MTKYRSPKRPRDRFAHWDLELPACLGFRIWDFGFPIGCFLLAWLGLACQADRAWGCYAVIVGCKASADGSVLVGHLEQNYGHRVLNFRRVPRQQFPEGSTVRLRRGGQIPQVAETAAVLWAENPGLEFSDAYLNEHGVAIVSDGCPTREDDYQTLVRRGEIRDGGIGFMLRRLVAQRARSARQGVEIAGQLLERFGYVDSGRTYVIADPREAWLLAVVRGRQWAACRVPDDEVVLLANVHIVGEVKVDDRPRWLASPRLIDYAVSRGWFDRAAGQPFHFTRVYAPETAKRPDPRQWWGQVLVAQPGKPHPREPRPPLGPLPLAVKPAQKMTVASLMAILRDTDGPVPLSTPLTQEGAVFQLRAWMPPQIGCVYWRTTAEPATSVFTPWYAGVSETPGDYCRALDVGTQLTLEHHFSPPPGTLDRDGRLAWWTFKDLQDLVHKDYAARIPRVRRAWANIERRILADQDAVEKKAAALWKSDAAAAQRFLTDYCADVAAAARQEARKLISGPSVELQGPGL
jgi:dipeptidase